VSAKALQASAQKAVATMNRMWRFAARGIAGVTLCLLTVMLSASTPEKRMVIADQDASGPGGSDMASLLVLLQSPEVNLLGITVVTGDAWRDPEVAHTLRLLEIVGRTDIRVYPGAAFPLVRTQQWTQAAEAMYGKQAYKGAWGERTASDGYKLVPAMREGAPVTHAADEDAAHFMIRMVHKYPHKVTIYAAGPLTNVALAIRIDPEFAELAQELVIMGGSLVPQTSVEEWANDPRHEFNFWFDPEAASITLQAKWAKITDTTIDASLKTRLAPEVLDGLAGSKAAAAQYVLQYVRKPLTINYLWDELAAAAWLDPSVVTAERTVYMDVNTDHGPNYGDTLTWSENAKPALPLNKVHAQMDVDLPKLQQMLIHLLTSPTPGAHALAP
jgi:inosine-uridine nucleoside N-ribohydrolase